jgi:hypothetical protein
MVCIDNAAKFAEGDTGNRRLAGVILHQYALLNVESGTQSDFWPNE